MRNLTLESILLEGLPLLAIFIYSVVLHEIAHGWVAERFGDGTARKAGRITLNPVPHVDPVMSLIVPIALWLFRSPLLIGAAKGVPVRMEALRPRVSGNLCVSLAGISVNLLLAVSFKLIWSVTPAKLAFWPQLPGVLLYAGLLNCLLAVFNLVPIPPLDGFAAVSTFLPRDMRIRARSMHNVGFFVLVFLLIGVPSFRGAISQAILWIWDLLPALG